MSAAAETLAERQTAFMRAILDDSAPLPAGWSNAQAAGLAVYRGNYRGALMGALASTYERTARHVGEAAFRRAGAHHLIAHPPSGWTIDDAGAGFAETCAELFAANAEVAELAWLEWAMLTVATAPDEAPLDAAGFAAATQGFGDDDWLSLRLTVQPCSTAREVAHDLAALWNALEDGSDSPNIPAALPAPLGCIVWREGERPVFRMVAADTARAFAAMAGGASYGEVIALLANGDDTALEAAALRAGQMLGLWLAEGIVTGIAA